MKAYKFIVLCTLLFSARTLVFAQQAQAASLQVESDVPKAEVYLNGIYQGLTPLTISPVEPGIWQLSLKKEGYYQAAYTIKITAGEQKKIQVVMKRITGILKIQNAPANAEIIVDERAYDKTIIELPEGIHTVTVRAFGYTEKTANVDIDREKEKLYDGALKEAPFSLNGLKPVKKSFNPENPANLGIAEITFNATAPGTAQIKLLNSEGVTVFVRNAGPFTTWKQTVRWDGTDSLGIPVEDGMYRIILDSEQAAESLTSEIRVDRTIIYPFTESFAGIGAAGQTVSASLMPKNTAALQFDLLYSPFSLSPGFSILAGFTDYLEGGVRAAWVIGENERNFLDFSGGLKAGMQINAIDTALSLRYSSATNGYDGESSFYRRGFALSPSVEYRFRYVSLGGNIEAAFGNEQGLFKRPYFSLSTGLALRFSYELLSLSLWGNAETGRSLAFDAVNAGLSASLLLPSTNLFLSAQTGYRINLNGTDSFSVRGGFGLML